MKAARHPLGLLLSAACLLGILLVIWYFLPLQAWYAAFITTLDELGHAALVAYAIVYIVATLFMVPLAPLAIAAGYLFGLYQSFAVSLLAATAGAVLAFFVSRHLLAAAFYRLLLGHPVMFATERSIAEQGWLIVFLLRLSPVIPSHLLNYLCGITEIPARHYIIATFLGKAPLIFMLSYIGALTARSLDQISMPGHSHLLIYTAGLIFTGIAFWLIVHRTREILHKRGINQ